MCQHQVEYTPSLVPRPSSLCPQKKIREGKAWYILSIFYLPKYSLSEVYFNRDRLLIEFNGLWYSLAARQVFAAIANPDSLSFGYRIANVRNTNIAQNHTLTIADTVPKWLNTPTLYQLGQMRVFGQAGGYLVETGSAWCSSGP